MQIERLDNGMELLLDTSGEADVAAIYAWVRAGSTAEPPGLEGAAHMLEHMVFKGTRSFGVGEVAAAIEGMGGDLNAFTSFDDTAFHCTVPAARAPEAIAVLGEMLREARIDAEELERERQVILEEIRGGEDDPDLVLGEASWAAAFPEHPYGRSVIGTVASVRGIRRDDLVAFYRRWYQPSNALLSVAGPVDVARVRDAARKAFSGGTSAPAREARVLTAARPRPKVLRRGFEATMVDLAYPVSGVGLDLAREATLDVLATALSGGRSSPMEARLRRKEGLCQSVSASLDVERDGGLFTVALHTHAGRATDAVRAARDELARARAGGLGEVDVARARAGLLAGMAARRESVDTRASDAAQDRVRYGDASAWRTYRALVASVTAEDVAREAARVFAPDAEVATALAPARERIDLTPEPTKPTLAAPPTEGRRGAASTGARAPVRHILDNGVRVLLEPGDGEMIGVRVTGLGGLLAEPSGASGRTLAWSRALTRGAGGLDAHAFACEVEALGAGLGASAGRSTQAVRGDFTRGNLAGGLELLAEALLRPGFPEEEIVRVRAELLAALDEKHDEPELLASERLWRLAYGDHPYGAPMAGTRASIARITPAALATHHARWLRPDNLVVSVAGGFEPEAMLRKLRRLLGRLPAGTHAPARPSRARLVNAEAPRRARIRSGREQAHVSIAWRGARVAGEEQPAMELLSGVLGGQGGRLFMDLRERQGLAYSVGAASHEGWEPGLLVASIATDPARADDAEVRLRASVEALAHQAVGDEELDRARTALIGMAEAELQSAGYRAGAAGLVERYGLDGTGYRDMLARRVGALTGADLLAVARTHLGAPLAIVRVDVEEDT